ncbi:hypothetical protein [Thioalbus denitrificans]|uniref:Uncharacterized protein n=1 Tax=Thioalbus denitrificans TaxID=547122 RepID=A0A369CG64_9GAMM|nr:hypothetical protein [Thioalbus denitrificans]RCX32075.1 hypothetical protein DFQ59_102428 [Thioalbus denitrificans]
MPKATAADITALGFSAVQFGAPDDWAAYVAPMLDDAEAFITGEIGAAAYAGAAGTTLFYLKRAEVNFVASELWRRRAVQLDADLRLQRTEDSQAYLRQREYLAMAQAAEDRAWDFLSKVTGSLATGGVAVGVVQSGPFTEVNT